MSQFNTFAFRAKRWATEAFGAQVVDNKRERAARFLEEAVELAQACGLTEIEAQDEVYKVYCRSVGVIYQEVGGVMVTLGVLTEILDLPLETCAEQELLRCEQNMERIRERNNSKKKYV